ncbi:hypothetical protein [Streptomyces himalayensis]|uniref:Uncharacterized protein n=1 Tax=Streptomyces himalayensis subsp. himalayensis TaxID=2756131 RepID=A0A7W0DH51_9ACTN|nr:hypothetical protein [Streptomyces himalayensis]MBA2944905.1 hypothetical protein [Streptomyces himalayensis subsp. himalayensis]
MHDVPHRSITDREWAAPGDKCDPRDTYDLGGPCDGCGSPHGPHATVTDAATGRHQQLCQQCARSSRPAARRPLRMCVRCDVLTDAPVLVSEVHQASGPGWNVYACPGCAPHFPPLPDVLDLFPSRSEEGER